MDLDLLSPVPEPWLWKLKDSLIQMPLVKEGSRELFFSSNVDPESAPMMV